MPHLASHRRALNHSVTSLTRSHQNLARETNEEVAFFVQVPSECGSDALLPNRLAQPYLMVRMGPQNACWGF